MGGPVQKAGSGIKNNSRRSSSPQPNQHENVDSNDLLAESNPCYCMSSQVKLISYLS